VLLVVFDFAVPRQEWIWRQTPRSQAGIIDALESQVIDHADRQVILFMGSSRMRDAVIPRQVEHELNLPTASVLNLGLNAGTPFDALVLYRRNRDRLRRARVLVFGIEDWYLNAAMAPNERDRRFASLGERLGVFTWDHTASLLLGWVWHACDARDAIHRYLTRLSFGAAPQLALAADGRIQWRDQELHTGPADADVNADLAWFYHDYTFSDGRIRQMRALIEMAQDDGLQVMIVQLPWRDTYVDQLQTKHPEAYRRYHQLAASLTQAFPGAAAYMIERASALAIPPTHYYDYGHLTIDGARTMTTHLTDLLRRQYARIWPRDEPATGQPLADQIKASP